MQKVDSWFSVALKKVLNPLLQKFQSVTTSFHFCDNRENLAGFLTSYEVINSFTGAHAESVKQNQESNRKGVSRAEQSRAAFPSYFPDYDTDTDYEYAVFSLFSYLKKK